MLNVITNWRRERSAIRQLSRLSDHKLADLGILRQDIKAVARHASTMTRDDSTAGDRIAGLGLKPAIPAYRPAQLAA